MKKKGSDKTMEMKEQLENDLNSLRRTLKIIRSNPIFINEEVNWIELKIKELEDILSVLRD